MCAWSPPKASGSATSKLPTRSQDPSCASSISVRGSPYVCAMVCWGRLLVEKRSPKSVWRPGMAKSVAEGLQDAPPMGPADEPEPTGSCIRSSELSSSSSGAPNGSGSSMRAGSSPAGSRSWWPPTQSTRGSAPTGCMLPCRITGLCVGTSAGRSCGSRTSSPALARQRLSSARRPSRSASRASTVRSECAAVCCSALMKVMLSSTTTCLERRLGSTDCKDGTRDASVCSRAVSTRGRDLNRTSLQPKMECVNDSPVAAP